MGEDVVEKIYKVTAEVIELGGETFVTGAVLKLTDEEAAPLLEGEHIELADEATVAEYEAAAAKAGADAEKDGGAVPGGLSRDASKDTAPAGAAPAGENKPVPTVEAKPEPQKSWMGGHTRGEQPAAQGGTLRKSGLVPEKK